MKRLLLLTLALAVLVGCQKKHPVRVFVAPAMKAGAIEKVAVFPFSSALHSTDDPDKLAPRTMDLLFREELDTRNDYNFLAPSSVSYALEGAEMSDRAERFIDHWRTTSEVDRDFLSDFATLLQVDAVLVGVVDLWQKDEVDYRENAAPTTYVGATVTILSVDDGSILFQASDENFIEGARTETTDRAVQRSGTGAVQRDTGASVYRAPEQKEVAIRVVRALVASIPVR